MISSTEIGARPREATGYFQRVGRLPALIHQSRLKRRKGRAKTPPIPSPAGLRVLEEIVRQILLTSGLDALPTIVGDSRPRIQLSTGEHIVMIAEIQISKVGALDVEIANAAIAA